MAASLAMEEIDLPSMHPTAYYASDGSPRAFRRASVGFPRSSGSPLPEIPMLVSRHSLRAINLKEKSASLACDPVQGNPRLGLPPFYSRHDSSFDSIVKYETRFGLLSSHSRLSSRPVLAPKLRRP